MLQTSLPSYSPLNGHDRSRIGLPTADGITMLLCRDIIRCEAHKTTCIFHVISGEKILVKKNLGFYEEKLMEWNFIKVHKSHLVNMHHVVHFMGDTENNVLLSDKSIVPVAQRKRAEFLRRFAFSTNNPERRALEELYEKIHG